MAKHFEESNIERSTTVFLPSAPSSYSAINVRSVSHTSDESPGQSNRPTLPGIVQLHRQIEEDRIKEARQLEEEQIRDARPFEMFRSQPSNHFSFSSQPVYSAPPPAYAAYMRPNYPSSPPITDKTSPSCRSASVEPISSPRHKTEHMASKSAAPKTGMAREDRHEYDAEEQFAICFLRMQSNASQARWKDLVNKHWRYLFPPGQPRRASAAASTLPAHSLAEHSQQQSADGAVRIVHGNSGTNNKTLRSTYAPRTPGGLQCRYYRLRDHLGVGQVRTTKARRSAALPNSTSQSSSAESGSSSSDAAAAAVLTKSEIAALRRFELELAQYWFRTLSTTEKVRVGVDPAGEEDDVEHMRRVRLAYRQHSEFWRLLSNIPDMNLYF